MGKNDVLVKMKTCGICGSDLEKIFGNYGMRSSKIGHEPAGEITEVGESVKSFSAGERVFIHHHVPCYSCHYCIMMILQCVRNTIKYHRAFRTVRIHSVPEWNVSRGGLVRLPDNVNFNQAALIEPIACCLRSLNN